MIRPAESSPTRWEPFVWGRHFTSYRDFALAEFGAGSYQALETYLHWLYRDNPASARGYEDMTVGVNAEGEVVGCVHKMQTNWSTRGRIVKIPAVHDLMVAEKYRRGLGLFLIMASFRGEDFALIPAAAKNAPFSSVYPKIRCSKVPAAWYRKILRPVHGAASLIKKRLAGTGAAAEYFHSTVMPLPRGPWTATARPDDALIRRLCETLNAGDGEPGSRPAWELATLRWRFFHPLGPKHMVIFKNSGKTGEKMNFGILSLGPRNGLNVLRLIAAHAESHDDLGQMLSQAEHLAARQADLFLIFTANARLDRQLQHLGWRGMRNQPDTYIYGRANAESSMPFLFSGEAGDWGFEAIPPTSN